MPLSTERTRLTAAAIQMLAEDLQAIHARLHKMLEYNSDQAINWVPATKTFTAANATDLFTATAHGLVNGQKARVTNAGGALPTGLAINTDYFLIGVTANTFQLSTTFGGATINITTDGTGTQTIHPVPDYIQEDEVGNINGLRFSRAAASNAVGSLDQLRNYFQNAAVTQGDHLGNLNTVASPPIV